MTVVSSGQQFKIVTRRPPGDQPRDKLRTQRL
jgi:hypothetical protein